MSNVSVLLITRASLPCEPITTLKCSCLLKFLAANSGEDWLVGMDVVNTTRLSWPPAPEERSCRSTVGFRSISVLGVIGEVLCPGFMPSELTKHHKEGFEFKEVPVEEILQGNYNELDPDCTNVIRHSNDRMPWRLYVHQPYEAWYEGKVCILGDAAHPMMVSYTHPFYGYCPDTSWPNQPHQAQGACQAIEDAAALGIIFSDKYSFTDNVEAGLAIYEKIRKGRATRIQQASARAAENLNERIGFTSLAPHDISLAATEDKLTSESLTLTAYGSRGFNIFPCSQRNKLIQNARSYCC